MSAGCRTGKERYHSSGQANAALQTIRTRGQKHAKKPTASYLCEFCKGWHLTSAAR